MWNPVRKLLSDGLLSGEIQPITFNLYYEVGEALRALSGGRHTGKLVVRVPQFNEVKGITKRRFAACGVHLVIGGLGGFGMELVQWLQDRGAERVVIVTHRKPSAYERFAVKAADIVTTDLSDPVTCDNLIQSLGNSLCGVWLLAMVLRDCLYTNMSEKSWNDVVGAKATIAANLDSSTRRFSRGLRNFVCWSSVVAQRGNAGQTNYAYANSSMEGVCIRRFEDGLCGLAIQWGLIGGVGAMADKTSKIEKMRFAPQHIDSCLEVLDDVLFSTTAVVTSYLPAIPQTAIANSLKLSDRVARALGVDSARLRPADSLVSLGMDSLQSIEIANILKGSGVEVPEVKTLTWGDVLALDV